MSRRNNKGKLPSFTAVFRHTTKSAAWKALSVGAKATFVVLQSLHNDKAQNAVFISARHAVEEYGLGQNKNAVGTWLKELEFYGFIVMVQGAHLGASGKGKSATYRLTDRYYAGKPPTYDFMNWGGSVLFEPKKRRVTDSEKARLNELNRSREKQNPVQRVRTHCPTGTDIKAGDDMAENGNKCPKPADIRTESECPNPMDISSSPSTEPASTSGKRVSAKQPDLKPWSTPTLTELKWNDDCANLYASIFRRRRGWRHDGRERSPTTENNRNDPEPQTIFG